MPSLPTDVCGKLYKDFDTYNIHETISARIDEWIRDLGSPWKDKEHRNAATRIALQIALDERQMQAIIRQVTQELRESSLEDASIWDADGGKEA